MNTRTVYIRAALTVLVAVLAISACDSPAGGGGGVGGSGSGYSVILNLAALAGMPSSQSRALSDTTRIDHFTLYLEGPEGLSQTHTVDRTRTTITVQLIAGTWHARVNAVDASGVVFGTGSCVAEVGPDKPNSVEITLNDVLSSGGDANPSGSWQGE
jgi:hypothetical protein